MRYGGRMRIVDGPIQRRPVVPAAAPEEPRAVEEAPGKDTTMIDKAASWIRRAVGGRPPVEFNREEAARLRAEGWTVRRIAEHFGISKSSVATYLKPEPQVVEVEAPVAQVAPEAEALPVPEAQPAAPTALQESLAALLNPGVSASQPDATALPRESEGIATVEPTQSEGICQGIVEPETPASEIPTAPESAPTVEPSPEPEPQEPWLVELRRQCREAAAEGIREAAEKF